MGRLNDLMSNQVSRSTRCKSDMPTVVVTLLEKLSIVAEAVAVLCEAGHPLSVAEIYKAIAAKSLYTFTAKSPMQVLHQQLRRHCLGFDKAASSRLKLFSQLQVNSRSCQQHEASSAGGF